MTQGLCSIPCPVPFALCLVPVGGWPGSLLENNRGSGISVAAGDREILHLFPLKPVLRAAFCVQSLVTWVMPTVTWPHGP